MKLDASNLEIQVFIESEGALSTIGHNLVIEATRLSGSVDGEVVEVTVPVRDLRVVGNVTSGQVDRTAPGDKDRRKIEENMLNSVLNAGKFSEVKFRGRREGDVVTGDLTICGVTRSMRMDLRAGRGEFLVHQPDFGIAPYKAFLGQLRIKADVRVVVREKS